MNDWAVDNGSFGTLLIYVLVFAQVEGVPEPIRVESATRDVG